MLSEGLPVPSLQLPSRFKIRISRVDQSDFLRYRNPGAILLIKTTGIRSCRGGIIQECENNIIQALTLESLSMPTCRNDKHKPLAECLGNGISVGRWGDGIKISG